MSRQQGSYDSALLTRRRLLGSGVAVSAAALAGCIGGDEEPADDGEPGADDEPSGNGNGGTGGDQLNFTQQVAPIEFDPIVANDAYSAQIYQAIYDGLYEYDPGTLDPQPKIAADAPEIERDGQRFIVELREEPEFHNGDPVTADDVVHTFLAPVEEETDNMPDVDMIESAEAVDDHAVQFDLENPYAPFETVTLASNIVNAEARQEDPDDYNFNPIGSGPYQWVDWEDGEFADIELWDDYWDDPSQVPEIRFEIAEDDAGRVSRILAQETHFIEGIPPEDWDQIEGESGIGIESVESTGYQYMAFNCTDGPTADPDVRRAIAHVHSVGDYVDDIFGEAAEWTNMSLAPATADALGMEGPDHFQEFDYEFDPDLAQELLDDSDAITEDDELEIIVPPDEPRENWAVLIASRLDEIGYSANVTRLDFDVLTDTYTTLDPDEFNIYSLGWTGGADPDVYFYQLFHEDNAGVTQGHGYENDEFHELIIEGRQEIDESTRAEVYNEVQEIILEDCVHLPGWTDLNAVAYVEDEVEGLQASTNTSTNPHIDDPDLALR